MAPGEPAAELVGVQYAGPGRQAVQPGSSAVGTSPGRSATCGAATSDRPACRGRPTRRSLATPAGVAVARRRSRHGTRTPRGWRRRAVRRPGPPTAHQARAVPDQDRGDDEQQHPRPRGPAPGDGPEDRGHRDHQQSAERTPAQEVGALPLLDEPRGAADGERRLEDARADRVQRHHGERADGDRPDPRQRPTVGTTRQRDPEGHDTPEPGARGTRTRDTGTRPHEGDQPPAGLQVALGLQPGGEENGDQHEGDQLRARGERGRGSQHGEDRRDRGGEQAQPPGGWPTCTETATTSPASQNRTASPGSPSHRSTYAATTSGSGSVGTQGTVPKRDQ